MSILIKGMDMPKRCGECPLSLYPYSPCWKNGGALDWENRHNRCPLLPVPPHGRLGDLGELAKIVLNWITTQEKAYPNEDSNALSWRLGARAMGNQIYRDIEAAPTIIPAEEDTDFFTKGHLHLGYAEEGE